ATARQRRRRNGAVISMSPREERNWKWEYTIREIRSKYREGWPLNTIAKWLNESPHEYPTRTGRGKWNHKMVSRVIDLGQVGQKSHANRAILRLSEMEGLPCPF